MLPLVSGIYKRGAGLGPATTFLYSAPAINVLVIVFSLKLLGTDVGLARTFGSMAFALAIGLIMAFIYRKDEETGAVRGVFATLASEEEGKSLWQQAAFLGSMVAIMVLAGIRSWIGAGIALVILLLVLWRYFSREEIGQWVKETGQFARLILPWFLVGALGAAVIAVLFPPSLVTDYVGGNNLLSCFIASFFGSMMYFCSVSEVPIVRAFMDLGMGKGPALALLLTGPALSLPSLLVLRKILGTKKMLTYVVLAVVLATISGFVFGLFSQ